MAPELAPWKVGGISNVVQKLANAVAQEDSIALTILGTVPHGGQELAEPIPGYHEKIRFLTVAKPSTPEPLYHVQLQIRYRSAITKWIARNPAGVIHFHILPGARTFLGAVSALYSGVPTVLTHYDWPPFEIRHYRARAGHLAHWWLSRPLLSRFPYLVANSRYIESAVRRRYPKANVALIPNGVSWREWQATVAPFPMPRTFRILHWGNLWKKKGVDLLLAAFAELRSHRDACLYVAGDGPDSNDLEWLAKDLGVGESVHFLGKVDQSQLRSLIEAADVAVFPSVYEGFGIAMMEAMASGKPVVTTALGGPQDFISAGIDGILVERSSRAICQALETLAGDALLRRSLGGAARRKAAAYDWSAIAPRYCAAYRRLSGLPELDTAEAPHFSVASD